VSGGTNPALGDIVPPSKLQLTSPLARRWPGAWTRLVRLARFGSVGVSGFVVNELAIAALVSGFGLNYLVGAVLATQVSSLWNFALVERWAFRDSGARRSLRHRMALFFAVNNVALLLRGPILVVLTSMVGLNYLVSNLISLGVLTIARFAIADSWIWAVDEVPDAGGVLEPLESAEGRVAPDVRHNDR
jgi:putative flippase GtrA